MIKKALLLSLASVLLINRPSLAYEKVKTGLDVLEESNFKVLKNQKVGLITNHTAYDNRNNYILEVFSKQKEFQLKAIFTPEHGLKGKEDKEFIPSEVYGENIPVYSLYGEVKKPTKEMLKDLDVLIYDIQDIGTRYYTFITTMAYCMEVASENNIKMIILDRPNPITGEIVEGEVLDSSYKSFTGYFEIPTRYGMTSGEIATYYKDTANLKLDLEVIKMKNWQRKMWYDETGLTWVNPSPNMRSLDAAILYPGLGMMETLNISVGRGTETPFIVYGTPWLDNTALVKEMNKNNFAGLSFSTIDFKPTTSTYANQEVKGFSIKITDRNKVKSSEAMLKLLEYINKNYPQKLNFTKHLNRSFGSNLLTEMLEGKTSSEKVLEAITIKQKAFLEKRKKYLLY